MKIKLLNILILLLFALAAAAQNQQKTIRMGDDAMKDGDYYAAYLYYTEAQQADPKNLELLWKCAEASRLFNNYREAERLYKLVYDQDVSEKYPESLFWYAMMKKQNCNFKEAGALFSQFIKKYRKKDKVYRRAEMEVKACAYADSASRDTLSVKIIHLDDNVNSEYAESAGKQLGDSAFMFTALRLVTEENKEVFIPTETQYLSKVFKAKVENKKIKDAEEVDRINIVEGKQHVANSFFSPDGKKLYFTRCDEINMSKYRCDIYVAEYSKGKFKTPRKLPDSVNYPQSNTTHPSLAVIDGKEVLFYSSDRPGGQGGLDIWYVVIDGKKISKPVNMGKTINTEFDEISPFYDSRKNRLYFASDGHIGFGGFDIYYSETNLKNIGKPVNIGYPINSCANDFFFTINDKDTNGYITSNRNGSFYLKGETCCNDIFAYEWQIPPKKVKKDTVQKITPIAAVQVKQVKKDTTTPQYKIRQMLPISLYFHNDEPDKKTLKTTTLKDYEQTYFEYIALKDIYKAEFSKGLSGQAKAEAENNIEEFFQNYVKKGYEKLLLYCSLLQQDLEAGKTVKITVKGYCSPLTTNEYNKKLAKRRISSMLNYFAKYNNGALKDYVAGTATNGGKLIIIEEPIGEEMANVNVSDNPNDKRNSVYSVSASLERKIQILKYSSDDELAQKPQPEAEIEADLINYKVFLLSTALPVNPAKFNGLDPVVSETNARGITSYFAGEFNNIADANIAKINLKKLGFPDAQVTAFRNGKKISLVDAQALIDQGVARTNPTEKSKLNYNGKPLFIEVIE